MTWKRVLTAAVMVPVVVAAVWWGSTALVAALTGLVTVLALWEFFALGEKIGMRGYRLLAAFCALAVVYEQWAAARAASILALPLELVLLLFVLGAAVIALASRRPLAEVLPAIGISAAALLFVALPLSFLVRIHGAGPQGSWLLLFTLFVVWVGDTLAYFAGRSMGRLPMAPQISPKKTWEGAAANLLGSLIIGAVFGRWLAIESRHLLLMAGLSNVAGQTGDLLESAYKRSAGVKDAGGLLPGHGGILDRIDALILAAPAVWYYFVLVVKR